MLVCTANIELWLLSFCYAVSCVKYVGEYYNQISSIIDSNVQADSELGSVKSAVLLFPWNISPRPNLFGRQKKVNIFFFFLNAYL